MRDRVLAYHWLQSMIVPTLVSPHRVHVDWREHVLEHRHEHLQVSAPASTPAPEAVHHEQRVVPVLAHLGVRPPLGRHHVAAQHVRLDVERERGAARQASHAQVGRRRPGAPRVVERVRVAEEVGDVERPRHAHQVLQGVTLPHLSSTITTHRSTKCFEMLSPIFLFITTYYIVIAFTGVSLIVIIVIL